MSLPYPHASVHTTCQHSLIHRPIYRWAYVHTLYTLFISLHQFRSVKKRIRFSTRIRSWGRVKYMSLEFYTRLQVPGQDLLAW
jgi:hypothetical protein